MTERVLAETDFCRPVAGWDWPRRGAAGFERTASGGVLSAPTGKQMWLKGPGVHTRNGDSIEIEFSLIDKGKGALHFGFNGGMEHATVALDFKARRASLSTSEWTRPQPVTKTRLRTKKADRHSLVIEKNEGAGCLVKVADFAVRLDGQKVLAAEGIDILPELGVQVGVTGTRVLLRRFVHKGVPSGVPEHLHVGGWQVLNRPAIDENLASLKRGLRRAAEKGVELLLTPETCLTGLFPGHKVTKVPSAIDAAEKKLKRFIRALKGAPFLVAGFPIWENVPGHRLKRTRYNVSRVYDPDGRICHTLRKIHSCESEFHHGYRYGEFEIKGVPVCMHVCHDGRYPDVWTLPVMFGARLVLHPANGGLVKGSIDAFEARAKGSTSTSHAFYAHVNGGGGSYIAGPEKFDNLLVTSPECRRDSPSFPAVGTPKEGLFHARVRVHDAFGYWPMRSFRASEGAAQAFLSLYRAMGGSRA